MPLGVDHIKFIRLKTFKPHYIIFETKGLMYDGMKEKTAAAECWFRAVNADGRFGEWQYKMSKLTEVRESLDEIEQTLD